MVNMPWWGTHLINLTQPNKAPVTGDRVRIEHDNGAAEEFYYREPEITDLPPETFLYITYPTSVVVGDLIRWEISVKFAGGSSVPVNGVFRVPIMRESDGKQMEYLKAVFSEGLANVSFTATEPGKLVMDMSKIDPTPTAKIVDSPVIFVDKTTG